MVELVIEDALIASLKVAVTFVPAATSTAACAGDDAVIVGGFVSGGGGGGGAVPGRTAIVPATHSCGAAMVKAGGLTDATARPRYAEPIDTEVVEASLSVYVPLM